MLSRMFPAIWVVTCCPVHSSIASFIGSDVAPSSLAIAMRDAVKSSSAERLIVLSVFRTPMAISLDIFSYCYSCDAPWQQTLCRQWPVFISFALYILIVVLLFEEPTK